MQQLDQDLRDVVTASLEYRAAYYELRSKNKPAKPTVFLPNSYVLARFPGRGPFLVLSSNGNAYHL